MTTLTEATLEKALLELAKYVEETGTPVRLTPTKIFHSLPWDYFQCQPVTLCKKCINCKRWKDHPDQGTGPRTAYLQVQNSKSKACSYIPISLLEEIT